MMTRRLGVAVAVLNGYLYAIGGSDGQCPLNTVERYDPRKNQWTAMAPMSTPLVGWPIIKTSGSLSNSLAKISFC